MSVLEAGKWPVLCFANGAFSPPPTAGYTLGLGRGLVGASSKPVCDGLHADIPEGDTDNADE